MSWRQFVMDLESLNPDRVEAVFARHGAQAISFCDAGSHPVLISSVDDTPLWPESRISGLFSSETDMSSLQQDLLESLSLRLLPKHHVEDLVDRHWEREWLKHFPPISFGNRLWVSPEKFEIGGDDAIVVHLDPGLAFGTGSHPTTALCLRWLDGVDLSGLCVLDYGCGSGIVGLAALKLGAASVAAVDADPQAIVATRENARKNGLAERLFVTQDVAEVSGAFDIVVANILAEPLVQIAGAICDRLAPSGTVVLSGILAGQVEAVIGAYRDRIDFEPPESDRSTDQIWVRLVGKRL
jgi:ribosomal protein L11 methyltransferase